MSKALHDLAGDLGIEVKARRRPTARTVASVRTGGRASEVGAA
jgi:hypothetical protein